MAPLFDSLMSELVFNIHNKSLNWTVTTT